MSDTSRRTRAVPGVARHGRLAVSRGWVSVVKALAAGLAVVLVATVSIAAIGVFSLVSSTDSFALPADDDGTPQTPGIGAMQGSFNILLSGSDTREGQGGLGGPDDGQPPLNDVNILLHVSADHSRAVAVSIPRDLITEMPACTNPDTGEQFSETSAGQINEALERGGMPCVVATVERLSGLSINYAGLITFRGVADMTDAIGGVPVCVSGPISDRQSGLTITADQIAADGTVTLQGEEALHFLRTRKGVGDGSDLGRISSQQVYMSAMVRELTSRGTLTDIGKVYALAIAAAQNMTLSENLKQVDTIVSMAEAMKDIRPANVTFLRLPVVDGTGAYSQRVFAQEEQTEELFDLISTDQVFQLGDGSVGVGAELLETPAPDPVPSETAPPTDAATPGPSDTAVPTPAPTLQAQGQTADQVTCSVANS